METLSPRSQTADASDLEGMRFDADIMFADHKGVYKPRIEKKQRKLAKKLSFLNEFLEDDEKLLVLTTAISPTSFLEQVTTGVVFVYLNRCLLVMTDRRIIHIPTTMGYKYRRSIAQIRYGDIATIEQKRSRLKIQYENGKKDLFLYIRGSERKKIRALLPSLALEGSSSRNGARVHLCPRCHAEQETDVYECAGCRLTFKNRKTATLLSVLLPGGGYFYTGHWLLGIADAFFEAVVILGIIASLIPSTEFPNGDPIGAIFFSVILAIEKIVTIYHARHFVKEYLTSDKSMAHLATG